MKKYIYIILILFVCLISSCSKQWPEPEFIPTKGINIIIGDKFQITQSDISHYDMASSQFYLNTTLDYENNKFPLLKFWILSDGNLIYDGFLSDYPFCGWSSSAGFYNSIMIVNKQEHPQFILKLDRIACWYSRDSLRNNDPRKGEVFIAELKKQGILKQGIDVNIESIQLVNDSSVTVNYKVTNLDNEDYFLLNPNVRTDNDLYDSKWSLVLMNDQTKEFLITEKKDMTFKYGEPWNLDWLFLLNSGESFSYSINYVLNGVIKSNNYVAYYSYPNLGIEFQSIEETQLDEGRIFLGKSEFIQDISITR